MKILFAIPTLFRKDRQEIINKCIIRLKYQCDLNNISYKIIVVCNIENEYFKNWKIKSDNIVKKVCGVKYNLAASLNSAIDEITDEDYFCFIHDDIIIPNNNWIITFVNLYEINILKCGILGIRPHYKGNTYYRLLQRFRNKIIRSFINLYKTKKYLSRIITFCVHYLNKTNLITLDFFNRLKLMNSFNIEVQSWVDGVMFFSIDKLKEIGKFNENYFGDCESEDFNYHIRESGYKIYRVILSYIHYSDPFKSKVIKEENIIFLNHVKKSRYLLAQKWGKKKDVIYP